jgi:hypothetical protein
LLAGRRQGADDEQQSSHDAARESLHIDLQEKAEGTEVRRM